MERLLPVDDSREVVIVNAGVAQDGVLESFAQSFKDERRCGEIHIGHPKGDEVCATIEHLQRADFGTVCTFATDNFVETVVLHDEKKIGKIGNESVLGVLTEQLLARECW